MLPQGYCEKHQVAWNGECLDCDIEIAEVRRERESPRARLGAWLAAGPQRSWTVDPLPPRKPLDGKWRCTLFANYKIALVHSEGASEGEAISMALSREQEPGEGKEEGR